MPALFAGSMNLYSPMTHKLTYGDIGTFFIESEIEPTLDSDEPGLPPFVVFSRSETFMTTFQCLKDLVVITGTDEKNRLMGFSIGRAKRYSTHEMCLWGEIKEMEGDRYVLWDKDGVKVLFVPT